MTILMGKTESSPRWRWSLSTSLWWRWSAHRKMDGLNYISLRFFIMNLLPVVIECAFAVEPCMWDICEPLAPPSLVEYREVLARFWLARHEALGIVPSLIHVANGQRPRLLILLGVDHALLFDFADYFTMNLIFCLFEFWWTATFQSGRSTERFWLFNFLYFLEVVRSKMNLATFLVFTHS